MILSPIMSYVVDKEVGFPTPSEKEKISKALKRYRYLLSQHPHRSDAPEILFGIADLLVSRGESRDYAEAGRILDDIIHRPVPDYLRARALVGKAELLIGQPAEADNAVAQCERAQKLLPKDLTDFFSAKALMVHAELLIARNKGNDWGDALKLIQRLSKNRKAHWYFRGRALVSQAEIILYRDHKKLNDALKSCNAALALLRSRPEDYFTNKTLVLKAEILLTRAAKSDFEKAEKALSEALNMSENFKDLLVRAKLAMARIVNHPQSSRLLKQVYEMEGLDPYLVDRARQTEQLLKEQQALKKKKQKK